MSFWFHYIKFYLKFSISIIICSLLLFVFMKQCTSILANLEVFRFIRSNHCQNGSFMMICSVNLIACDHSIESIMKLIFVKKNSSTVLFTLWPLLLDHFKVRSWGIGHNSFQICIEFRLCSTKYDYIICFCNKFIRKCCQLKDYSHKVTYERQVQS